MKRPLLLLLALAAPACAHLRPANDEVTASMTAADAHAAEARAQGKTPTPEPRPPLAPRDGK